MRNIKYFGLLYLLLASSAFSAELPNEKEIVHKKALAITSDDYFDSKQTAIKDIEYLSDFTNHTDEHFLMVAEKSDEIINTFAKAIKKGKVNQNI